MPFQDLIIMSEVVNSDFHINDLFMWCNDIHKMKDFYSNILGLKEIWVDLEPTSTRAFVVYKFGNNQSLHFLSSNDKIANNPLWSFQPSSEIETGIEKFSWTLETSKANYEEIVKRIETNNVKTYETNTKIRTGYTAVTLLDPMGNTIDLYYAHSS